MDLIHEQEVEESYNKLVKKAAIISLVLLIVIGVLFIILYKDNKTGDKASGYSLKCFQNHTTCDNRTGNCQNITPTESEIEDCLRS